MYDAADDNEYDNDDDFFSPIVCLYWLLDGITDLVTIGTISSITLNIVVSGLVLGQSIPPAKIQISYFYSLWV